MRPSVTSNRSSISHAAITVATLACVSGTPILPAAAAKPTITVASTTSTDNSGLLAYLLPKFSAQTGIEVRVIAVGTGQAMRIGRNGDADVLLVHHAPSEIEFVEKGYGSARVPVMHNDFVLVGPAADPAGIRGNRDIANALTRIAATRQPFVSRGDDSGTHSKERELWRAADLDPTRDSGRWYLETGSGQGATLNIASAMDAYTLTDRATWMKTANKGALGILVDGDERLFNPYSAILVNPRLHPHVQADAGQTFIDWLVSDRGQTLIGDYRIEGEKAFFPDAGRVPVSGSTTDSEAGAPPAISDESGN